MVFSTRLSKTLSTAIVCTHPVAPALHLGQEGFFCSHWLRHSPQNMWPQGTTECVATIKSCVGTAFPDIGSKKQSFPTISWQCPALEGKAMYAAAASRLPHNASATNAASKQCGTDGTYPTYRAFKLIFKSFLCTTVLWTSCCSLYSFWLRCC